ncbi:MAG: hypothetical protein OXG55_02075 [bacterium]|nr:hypothetical protein [bacterium]MCY3951933.1 hypothetical protein [bacterium]MCY4102043.1 hypothetical protein [bacterium]
MANGSAGVGSDENRPLIVATAALTFIPNGEKFGFDALVDTGVQRTAVTATVVSRLKTMVSGSGTLVAGVDGTSVPIGTLWLRIGAPSRGKAIGDVAPDLQPQFHHRRSQAS